MNVGRIYDLLTDKDIEPMAPLVDLWVKQGVLPAKKENTPASAGGGNSAAQPSGGDAATQAEGSSSSASGADKTTAYASEHLLRRREGITIRATQRSHRRTRGILH